MNGHFTGLTSNNASFCHNTNNPTVSSYFTIKDSDGSRNSEHKIPPFLEFFPGEGDSKTSFLKFWCFGGIVETNVDEKGGRRGVCYYEARELRKDALDDGIYLYTGLASIAWNPEEVFLEAKRAEFLNGPQLFLVSNQMKS
jgi:hypothetical protein